MSIFKNQRHFCYDERNYAASSDFKKFGRKNICGEILTTCFGAEGMDVAVEDLILAQIEDEELPEREERIYLGKEWCGFYPVNHWTVCGGSEAETGDGDREDASGNPGVA